MAGGYVALIRGVNNIGKTTRVGMDDLRAAFERLGFHGARTLLNSGNVVFAAPRTPRGELLARIERALRAQLGIESQVTLLSKPDVAAIVRDNPFAKVAKNPSNLLVVVLPAAADLEPLRPLTRQRWAPEGLALGKRVAYLWCANGLAKSPLRIAAERALGKSGTGRNFATMTKILAMLDHPPGPDGSHR